MDQTYDVIIVGAGTAGAHCARVLAKSGIKVLMVEKQKEIGEPNFSTAGTPEETIKVFGLPPEVAPYSWDKIYIASANEKHLKTLEKNRGYVFDFRRLRSWLAEEVATAGGEIAVDLNIKEPIIEDRKIVGLKYQGLNCAGELRAKIIVDASGNSAFLASKLGLIDQANRINSVGLELEMANVNFPTDNTLFFYMGDDFIPNGYAWIFPLSKNVAKIGVGRITNIAKTDIDRITNNKPYDIKNGLMNFINKIEWLKDAQPLEFHSGSLSFDEKIKNFVKDNFIVIGTAASHVNPLGGEGIRHSFYSAQFAAEVIIEALAQNDTSESKLQEFNKRWLKYSDNNWETCQKLARWTYGDTNNQKMDDYVASLQPLSGDDWFDILFNYNFKKHTLKIVTDLVEGKIKDLLVPQPTKD